MHLEGGGLENYIPSHLSRANRHSEKGDVNEYFF